MKRKRLIAAALTFNLIITIFATGCIGFRSSFLLGGPGYGEESAGVGGIQDNVIDLPTLQSPETVSYPEPGPSVQAPEAGPTTQKPETAPPVETTETATPDPAHETDTPVETPEPTAPASPAPPVITTPPPIPVESITLDVYSVTVNRNSSYRINHTVFPANATNKTVRYSSSDTGVVTVSNDGRVQARGAGTAVVQCISASGIMSEPCLVTVVVPVTRVSVSTDKNVYKVGEICSYSVSVFPEDATDKLFTLSISNGSDAEPGDNTLECASSGRVTITATASNGIVGSKEINIVDLVELAAEVFRLTNIERQNHGLSDYSRNGALTATAVVRARECILSFSHTRPDGRDCFTAFAENGVSYISAGENIAFGQTTPAEVVTAWMNSPGHRASILNPVFGHLGVGVELDSNGRLYWSQLFTD